MTKKDSIACIIWRIDTLDERSMNLKFHIQGILIGKGPAMSPLGKKHIGRLSNADRKSNDTLLRSREAGNVVNAAVLRKDPVLQDILRL